MNVGTLIERAGERYGDKIALEDESRSVTFAEAASSVNRLAQAFAVSGLQPGDRVLDLQTNSVDFALTDYAMATAGLVRVGLNYRHQPADWRRIAEDCGARGLVIAKKFEDQTTELRQSIPIRICIDGEASWCASAPELVQALRPRRLPIDVHADDLVSLNYSSGTTGRPKGALRTHRNRLASLANIITEVLRSTPLPDDVWCHAGPLTHASGLFSLPHFAFGARQVILPEWDPAGFVDAVRRRGVTASVLVPTMIVRLLASPALPVEGLPTLRRLVYAGAPMPPDQIREARARITTHLIQMYGLVEAIPPITVLDEHDHSVGVGQTGSDTLLSSAGRPCTGVELKVVDEAGEELPNGEIGEVVTRGDHTMTAYWGADDADVAKSVIDGWLHTGDLGWWRDGRLYLVDRKGDMIISGGYNIYPREVEEVLASAVDVDQVAVFGVADADWGQRVIAVVTSTSGAALDTAALQAHCARHLASYKKPKEIHQVASMPLGVTGKISKKTLAERVRAGVQA